MKLRREIRDGFEFERVDLTKAWHVSRAGRRLGVVVERSPGSYWAARVAGAETPMAKLFKNRRSAAQALSKAA